METTEKSAETFNAGLKSVFQKLLKREKPITDDTSLQKLCDFVPEFGELLQFHLFTGCSVMISFTSTILYSNLFY